MFSEVVKLVPTIDRAGLNSMFQNLSARFSGVARKFGDGMKAALKFGGLGAITSLLAAKLLNPLQKAEELIDKIIGKGDDAVTNAEEFNSDPGKLLRLEAVARAKGLDAEQLRSLISKFQGALAKEQEAATAPAKLEQKLSETQDPLKRQELQIQLKAARDGAAEGGVLHEFINETDTVDAFFKFIQSLQKVDKPTQTVVQSQIFGERVRGKAAEFFNATDLAEILAKLPSSSTLKTAAEKTGKLSDQKDLLTAIRETEDFVTKSTLVKESQIIAIDQSERQANRGDDKTLQRFDALKSSSIAIQELTQKFDAFATDFINNVAPELIKGINIISGVATEFMPSFKEVKGVISTGFDVGLESLATLTTTVGTVWDKGGEVINGALETAARIATDFTDVWAQFKSSRIYRTFGGD